MSQIKLTHYMYKLEISHNRKVLYMYMIIFFVQNEKRLYVANNSIHFLILFFNAVFPKIVIHPHVQLLCSYKSLK